jgi:hypothetical protein
MIAAELIKRGANYYAKETAVIYKDQKLTFEEVHKNSNHTQGSWAATATNILSTLTINTEIL